MELEEGFSGICSINTSTILGNKSAFFPSVLGLMVSGANSPESIMEKEKELDMEDKEKKVRLA